MKELVIITASPASLRFAWENYIYLNNLREKSLSHLAQILIWIPNDKLVEGAHPMWKQLEKDFPETKFFYFPDNNNIQRLCNIFDYIPLLRPYCLSVHFKANPSLSKKGILYTDSDILLTEHFDFTPFLEDDICYVSEAKSYTNSGYFDSKLNLKEDGTPEFVSPIKYQSLKRRDILDECAKICGITRQIVEENKENSGAAQYLLKNVDYKFWNNVFDGCIELRMHLQGINQEYMQGDTPLEKENKGWQSWCADIWAVTWNLYRRNYNVLTPKEFDFAWATDELPRLKEVAFYHNAGITSDSKFKRKFDKQEVEAPAFFKGASQYTRKDSPITPFHPEEQEYLQSIINNPISSLYCNAKYVEEIIKVKQKYNL